MIKSGQVRALSAKVALRPEEFGQKAHTINRLRSAKLPVPEGFALSVAAVREIANKGIREDWDLSSLIAPGRLKAIRSSPVSRFWGGPETLVNIGMNRQVLADLSRNLGERAATEAFCHFVQEYAVSIKHQDAETFRTMARDCKKGRMQPGQLVASCLEAYRALVGEEFPEDPVKQLGNGLKSMIAAWDGTSARILRSARGAPPDAGLGLIVQDMVPGFVSARQGAVQFLSPLSGEAGVIGRFLPEQPGSAGRSSSSDRIDAGDDHLASAFDTSSTVIRDMLSEYGLIARRIFRDEMRLDFLLDGETAWILDAVPAERSTRANLAIAVGLVDDGLVSRQDALFSVDPLDLNDAMLAQLDPRGQPDVVATGVAASPGAATGRIVFSAMAAQAMKAREQECVLVRVETSPEDVRGMYSASAILTEKGGMTSHAAVVARGLGVPCVTGATAVNVDARTRTVTIPDGRVLREGDVMTVDGTGGQVVAGAPGLVEPDLDGAFGVFMSWADEARTLGVRANSDTALEASLAREIGVDGIGLVRTEHMVIEPGRLTLMRELILAQTPTDRQVALERLLPMQRADFIEIFGIMQGLPVCIRLLGPAPARVPADVPGRDRAAGRSHGAARITGQ